MATHTAATSTGVIVALVIALAIATTALVLAALTITGAAGPAGSAGASGLQSQPVINFSTGQGIGSTLGSVNPVSGNAFFMANGQYFECTTTPQPFGDAAQFWRPAAMMAVIPQDGTLTNIQVTVDILPPTDVSPVLNYQFDFQVFQLSPSVNTNFNNGLQYTPDNPAYVNVGPVVSVTFSASLGAFYEQPLRASHSAVLAVPVNKATSIGVYFIGNGFVPVPGDAEPEGFAARATLSYQPS